MKIGCEKRKEETTAEIETQTTFKCYTLVLVERGQTGGFGGNFHFISRVI